MTPAMAAFSAASALVSARGAEVRAQRQVDHVEVVGEVAVAVGVDRPVDRQDGEPSAAGAAEDAQRVEQGAGGHSRADAQGAEGGRGAVGTGVGGAAAVHAEAGGGPRDVR